MKYLELSPLSLMLQPAICFALLNQHRQLPPDGNKCESRTCLEVNNLADSLATQSWIDLIYLLTPRFKCPNCQCWKL